MITIHLPEDLQSYVQAIVLSGRFASKDEAITEAVRLMKQRDQEVQPSPQKPLTEEEFEQHLVEIGLMSAVPPPRDPARLQRAFQPVVIEGEPLSETIIRERR